MRNFPYFVLMRATWMYAEGVRQRYVLAIFGLALSQAIWLFGPYIMGQFFNVVQEGLKTDEQIYKAIGLLILNFSLQPITWAFHGPARIQERRCGFYVRQNFVQTGYKKLCALPYAWHQNFHTGQLYDRLRKAEDALEDFASGQLRYIIFIMNFFGPIVALLILFKWFGLGCLGFAFIAAVMILNFDRKLIPIYEENNRLSHSYAGVFSDYLANIRTIIALRLSKQTEEELLQHYSARKKSQWQEYRLNEWKWFTMDHMAELVVVGMVIIAILLVRGSTEFKIGSLIMLVQYLQRFSGIFYGLGDIYSGLVKSATNFKSISVIDEAYQKYVSGKNKSDTEDSLKNWNTLSIRNLSFAYEDSDHRPHAIQNIDLDIKRGEKIAFVGASGSGKSTLMTLLRGLYQADKGFAVMDGNTFKDLEPLGDITTLIPQDPEIFENTIRYNITFGVTHSDDEIKEACEIACFDDVLAMLPLGLESDVREKGVNLSGGQKQRLALARGVFAIRESSLILMDEPTSSVDTLTELRIFDRLFTEFNDKTIIASVHRLHLLSRFDRIVMIDNGKIIQQGHLSDLIRQPGLFASLWAQYQEQRARELRDER